MELLSKEQLRELTAQDAQETLKDMFSDIIQEMLEEHLVLYTALTCHFPF